MANISRITAVAASLLLPLACFAPPEAEVETDSAGTDSSGGASSSTTAPGSTSLERTASTGSTTEGGSSGVTTGVTTAVTAGTDETEGTTEDTGDAGTSEDTGTTNAGDVTPPEVVAVAPLHGSTHVIDDPVRLEFSEAMNTASFEAAFPTATGFVWEDGDTVVTFELPFPFADSVVLFDITVPTSVQDVAGNGLEEAFVATVSLAELVSVTLEYQSSLTGNVSEGATTYFSFFFGGDSTANLMNYGGVSFALDALPGFETTLGVYTATYATQVISVDGNPNDAELGGFLVDHVEFDAGGEISNPTVLEAGFFDLTAAGELAAGDAIAVEVSTQLEASWSDDASHLQLRLHPGQASENETADRFFLRRGADENGGIVDGSVMDPDASSRSRLEVEYFSQ